MIDRGLDDVAGLVAGGSRCGAKGDSESAKKEKMLAGASRWPPIPAFVSGQVTAGQTAAQRKSGYACCADTGSIQCRPHYLNMLYMPAVILMLRCGPPLPRTLGKGRQNEVEHRLVSAVAGPRGLGIFVEVEFSEWSWCQIFDCHIVPAARQLGFVANPRRCGSWVRLAAKGSGDCQILHSFQTAERIFRMERA